MLKSLLGDIIPLFRLAPKRVPVSSCQTAESWRNERASQFREPRRSKHCRPQRGRSAQRDAGL